MDLNSLLNNQKDTRLSLNDLQQLLAQGDSVVIFEKIQNSTAYDLPINRADTFVFFDTFIQVILSIIHDDDPYSAQLSKSIVTDSLRSCINGLLRQNGIEWLIEFPSYFSTKTWVVLRANITILVYLYGLVLAIWNKPELIRHREEWMKGILQFVHSNSPIVMLHLWLNCCCMLNQDVNTTSDAEELYLFKVEAAYNNGKLAEDAVITMIRMLQEFQVDVLAEQVNQQLGSALARPPFTKDEFIVGKICLDNACNSRLNRYTSIRKIYQQMQAQTALEHATSGEASNPLLSTDILASTPADKYLQTEAIRKATLFWLQKMGALYPHEFDLHLKEAIQSHYPTDRKTILDLALADWTARDRFHRHLGFVMDVIIAQLQKSRYNRRTSPYYAFVQLFNIPDDHQQQQQQQTSDISLNDNSASYQTKSGAYIDLSEFSNCSDVVLMDGCCSILQKLTLSGNNSSVEDWVADCLQSASADIVKRYAEWLAQGLEKELITKQTPFRFAQYTKVLLKTCVSQSAHVVPTLLHTFSDHGLEWLLKKNTSFATILLHYFDDGPQVSKDIVVRTLFTSKSKVYMDRLLAYLRQHMSGTDPKLPRSRSWFRNHFLSNLLLLVGEDTKGKSVASGVFRQLLKTRSDFEWYFATPLVSTQQMTFSTLDLCSTHDVYAIKHTGLAALLQEMVRLGDGAKKERLIKVWSDLWTLPRANNDYKFTVPVSWVLQCAGLYDQAPVLVKQMIKKFLTIGIHQSTLAAAAAAAADQEQSILPTTPGRTFLERVMDLILLSDTPEPDSLFELVLNVYYSQEGSRTFGDINWAIIHILVELAEELEVEMLVLASASNLPPPRPNPKKIYKKRNKKYNKKQHMSRLKLGATMKKHEEELERYFQELSDNTSKINNAIKALTTLVQRVFNFLLRLLNDTSTFSTVDSNNSCLTIKQDIQRELVEIPLFYEPLAKLDKLISEPEDLHEDIQTVIELSVECLKKKADQTLYEASQKILLATS